MTKGKMYIFWALLLVYAMLIFGLNLGNPGVYAAQEGRAGVIARNMIKSGDYMTMTFKDNHTTEKPIFCYWVYSGFCNWLGVTEVAVRLPSAIAAVITVLLSCYLGGKIYGASTGFLTGFILSSMVSFVNLGRIARIDAILCMFFMLAMILFYKAYLEKKKPVPLFIYLFYVVLAVSVLVKGPVSVVLAGLIILGLAAKHRNWKMLWEMKPFSGFLIGTLIALPWYVYESVKTNGSFALDFLWNQNMDRFLGLNTEYCEGKRKTTFFYFPNLLAGALPWSVFFPFGLWQFRKKFLKFRMETDFLIIWFAAVFCFFSFSFIKRGDYILPLYPAAAILLAHFITWGEKQRSLSLSKYWVWIWAFLVLVFGIFMSAVYSGVVQDFAARAASGNTPFVGERDAKTLLQICELVSPYFWYASLAGLISFGAVFVCGYFFERGNIVKGAMGLACIFLIFNSIFVQWLQPYTDNTYRSVRDFMLRAEKHIPKDEVVAYFKISNMEEAVFYLDRDYSKHWTDKELLDESGTKLKYKYIFCPPENYDDIPPCYRRHTLLIDSTPEGHQYPMALIGPKEEKDTK
ncbi:MAG: hypothetical protein A2020_15920 [Lentisphaerae bacterium GWF2_45_14]|nr:MAG: hypothetical protein A2020_15920 [Lentisphaerae bacterium GWF2_45_14]